MRYSTFDITSHICDNLYVERVDFYRRSRGDEPVRKFLDGERKSNPDGVGAIFDAITLLAERGHELTKPHTDTIDSENGIRELRGGPYRIAYIRHGEAYVLLHAWRKRGQKLDPKALKRAQSRRRDWRERHPP